MKKSFKKLIAPIIITTLIIIYFAIFVVGGLLTPILFIGRFIGIIIPLVFIGVSIYVLIERIKEIRSGEEDDLSKY